MNTAINKATDSIANWTAEAAGYRQTAEALREALPTEEKRLLSLALAIKQGNPEAIAEASRLRTEIAGAREEIELCEEAARQLDAIAHDELHAEQKRADRHLRRKTAKAIAALPAMVKDVERHLVGFVETYAALHAATEAIAIPYRDGWAQKSTILYTATINRLVGHAAFVLLREKGVKLPEIKFSELDFEGLHRSWLREATRAKNALLNDDPTVPADEPTPAEPEPAPTVQGQPAYVSDEEIARANVDGSAQDRWPLSGPAYVRAITEADKLSRRPVMPRETDPWTGEEI